MLKLRIFNTKIPLELKPIQLSTETSKKNDFLIGRAPHCDVILDNATVSREHGKISFEGNQYHFIDLGSTNGSQINNIERKAFLDCQISVNDIIQLGDFTILIEEIVFESELAKSLEGAEFPTEPSVLQLNMSINSSAKTVQTSGDRRAANVSA